MCGSQSKVWLIDKGDKDRPHDESSEVMSHGQVTEHVPDHVTEHVMDHVTEHVTDHVTEHVTDHVTEHVMDHVTSPTA